VSNGAGGAASGAGAGTPEIWTSSGGTATAYTISGGAIAKEGASPLSYPSDDWSFNDGYANLQNAAPGPATVADTVTGDTAPIAGTGYSWKPDPQFGAVLGFDGSTTYVTPPAATVPATDQYPAISLWFQTTSTAGGILASLQGAALSSGDKTVARYDPVLYIGNDGYLHAEFATGRTVPVRSKTRVDTGSGTTRC